MTNHLYRDYDVSPQDAPVEIQQVRRDIGCCICDEFPCIFVRYGSVRFERCLEHIPLDIRLQVGAMLAAMGGK